MDLDTVLTTIAQSSPDDWVGAIDLDSAEGYNSVFVYKADVSLTLGFGRPHSNGESWTEPWSRAAGMFRPEIYGYYLDVRWNGALITQDLLLSVDGARGIVPSGSPIAADGTGITGAEATANEIGRARLLDALRANGQFDHYAALANIREV